jgi:hypothetical protein
MAANRPPEVDGLLAGFLRAGLPREAGVTHFAVVGSDMEVGLEVLAGLVAFFTFFF